MQLKLVACFLISPFLLNAQKLAQNPFQANTLNSLKQGLGNGVTLHDAQASYNFISNSGSETTASRYGDLRIESSWSIASVPFSIAINNQTWNTGLSDNFSNALLHFDREIYLESLKKKMSGAINVEELKQNISSSSLQFVKAKAEQLLKKDLDDLNKTFGGELGDKIKSIGNIEEVFNMDIGVLRQALLSNSYLETIEKKQKLLSELTAKKNINQPYSKEDLSSVEKDIKKMKGVTELLNKIEEHKNKWEESGLLNKIRQENLLNKKKIEQLIKDPGAIAQFAKERFDLNSFQKLFLKINKLNIGQNTLSESDLSVQHLLNKGINTEFLNNNRYLMMGVGKIKSINSILDRQFTNNLHANDGMMKMISVGLGGSSSARSRLSVSTFDQSMNEFTGLSILNTFRTSLVTTISNEFNIGSKGLLTAEISRSATSYNNFVESDTNLQNKSSLSRIIDADNLWKNMAFAIKYENELEEHDLTYGINVSKTANGYVNPGNTLLNSGGKELGVKIRKSFFKRSLQASLRSNMREYNYGEDNRKLWRNYYSVLDVKFKLGRGQSIGVRYIPNKMFRVEDGKKEVVTSVDRFSIEGNISKKIFGLYYRNNISVASQKNGYLLDSKMITNSSVTFSSFQNIIVRQQLIYLNLNYDHAKNSSDFVYLNSSLMADVGSTYMVFKKISLSSAISFNSVKSWYTQLGIKQTISNQLSDRWNINVYIDARKNLALYQPLLYGPFRADVSVHYLIKR